MVSKWIVLVMVGPVFAFSFGCPPPIAGCPPVVLPGIRVDLTNAQTGSPISGATLTLTEGGYAETMQESGPGVYLGAFGRSGTYSLSVQADEFDGLTRDDLQTNADQCGVVTTAYSVQLQPT